MAARKQPENRDNTGRDDKGRFAKGGPTPNPKGRPKRPKEFTALAREMSVIALERVRAILLDADTRASDVIAATRLIWEYGLGKAVPMSDNERLAMERERLELDKRRVEAEMERTGADEAGGTEIKVTFSVDRGEFENSMDDTEAAE